MRVIPAIDVLNGKVVRLRRGLRDEVTVYGELEETISNYQKAGIKRIHVVDLNSAFGESSDLLSRLKVFSGVKFQIGGGFRSIEKMITTLWDTKFDVVVGSLLTSGDATLLKELERLETKRIIAALDVMPKTGSFFVRDNGWLRDTKRDLFQVLAKLQGIPFQSILVTDISRDGELSGPNISLYRLLQERFPELRFTASGGVRSALDFSALDSAGLSSVVVGKALYEKNISLTEVLSWQQ